MKSMSGWTGGVSAMFMPQVAVSDAVIELFTFLGQSYTKHNIPLAFKLP